MSLGRDWGGEFSKNMFYQKNKNKHNQQQQQNKSHLVTPCCMNICLFFYSSIKMKVKNKGKLKDVD